MMLRVWTTVLSQILLWAVITGAQTSAGKCAGSNQKEGFCHQHACLWSIIKTAQSAADNMQTGSRNTSSEIYVSLFSILTLSFVLHTSFAILTLICQIKSRKLWFFSLWSDFRRKHKRF